MFLKNFIEEYGITANTVGGMIIIAAIWSILTGRAAVLGNLIFNMMEKAM